MGCHVDTEVCMELISNGNGTHSLWMNNDIGVQGIQFDIIGSSITSVTNIPSGFISMDDQNTVMIFSISGATIPPGEHTQVLLIHSTDDKLCIDFEWPNNPIMADANGTSLLTTVKNNCGNDDHPCNYGCTDPNACNYTDDILCGDNCEYPDHCWNCDGDRCECEEDCAGICTDDPQNQYDCGGFCYGPDVPGHPDPLWDLDLCNNCWEGGSTNTNWNSGLDCNGECYADNPSWLRDCFIDSDNDGYGTGNAVPKCLNYVGCPGGWSLNALDENDNIYCLSNYFDSCGVCDGNIDDIETNSSYVSHNGQYCNCNGSVWHNCQDSHGCDAHDGTEWSCGGDINCMDNLGCGCGESGPSGCDNTCGSTLVEDQCGVCGGTSTTGCQPECSTTVQCVDDTDCYNALPEGAPIGTGGLVCNYCKTCSVWNDGCGCEIGCDGNYCDNVFVDCPVEDECGVCGGDGSSCQEELSYCQENPTSFGCSGFEGFGLNWGDCYTNDNGMTICLDAPYWDVPEGTGWAEGIGDLQDQFNNPCTCGDWNYPGECGGSCGSNTCADTWQCRTRNCTPNGCDLQEIQENNCVAIEGECGHGDDDDTVIECQSGEPTPYDPCIDELYDLNIPFYEYPLIKVNGEYLVVDGAQWNLLCLQYAQDNNLELYDDVIPKLCYYNSLDAYPCDGTCIYITGWSMFDGHHVFPQYNNVWLMCGWNPSDYQNHGSYCSS